MGFWYKVSLQVRHPSLSPADIESGLAMTARAGHASGTRATPRGDPLPGVYEINYCAFPIGEGEDGELADCLRSTITGFEAVAEFIAGFIESGGSLCFHISWEPGDRGEIFDARLMRDLGRLGIDLGIDPLCVD